MTNNNIGLHHGVILLTAALLLLIPSLVNGQIESTKSSGDRENSEIRFSSLADAYQELSRVIERESKELEQLKLAGASRERISESRRNTELAQRIDAGLAQLEKIREEKN